MKTNKINPASLLTITFIAVTMVCHAARGEQALPNIGCMYPAGAQRGTTAEILVSGQNLFKPEKVYVSGEGVKAEVVEYVRPIFNLDVDKRKLLREKLTAARDARLEEIFGKQFVARLNKRRAPARKALEEKAKKKIAELTSQTEAEKKNGANKADEKKKQYVVKLPNHPLLNDIENKSLRELAHIAYTFYFPREMKQQNRQIAESVLIKLTVSPDAVPGPRQLRIESRLGLSNPLTFEVGTHPETQELEPNHSSDQQQFDVYQKRKEIADKLLKVGPVETPATINGRIMPGDTDAFTFKAEKGQRLVIQTHARSLVPYLADAVPGWFQATVTLYDSEGTEIAYADDFQFHPDPVLIYEIPYTDEYKIEIRDSIYRGREDFVYRLTIAEDPYIKSIFPLGGKAGSPVLAKAIGWNLPETEVPLDTRAETQAIHFTNCHKGRWTSNPVPYSTSRLPEALENDLPKTANAETGTNNSDHTGSAVFAEARRVTLPIVINGVVSEPAQADVYAFEGKKGQQITAEVFARTLNSPLDSLVKLIDSTGKTIAFNDDHSVKDSTHLHIDISGLMTHHADSYLTAELPGDGTYYMQISDCRMHGSEAHAYRLRVSEPMGDFALRVTPSSLTLLPGSSAAVCVHVLRKDGFDGPIRVELDSGKSNFTLSGSTIPAGCDKMMMTVSAPGNKKAESGPVKLTFTGHARANGRNLTRTAVPADDTMQAFLYRHLVPADEMLAVVMNTPRPVPQLRLASENGKAVKLAAGKTAAVHFKTKFPRAFQDVKLTLCDPPAGVELRNYEITPDGLMLVLAANKNEMKLAQKQNLIIEAEKPNPRSRKNANGSKRKLKDIPLGTLPAIPVELAMN